MLIFAGPCVIEGELHALSVAEKLARIGERLGTRVIYKSSFDKANRSSSQSPRGPGLRAGLDILAKVKSDIGLEVITDVHECHQVEAVASVVDMLQIPAFLCRQTDLLTAAVRTGKPVLVKKGQFMSPDEMANVVAKAQVAHDDGQMKAESLMLCERGTFFGYNDLVVDMRSMAKMAKLGHPIVFDATHSVQRPGAKGACSGGDREFVPMLARAAAGIGIDGLFIETHPDPAAALSDASTAWPLDQLEGLLEEVLEIDRLIRGKTRALPQVCAA